MKLPLWSLLLKRKNYFLVSMALALSGVGTAFTSIVVYAELAKNNAPPLLYSVVFILGLAPGLFSSALSGKLAGRSSTAYGMAAAQLVGGGLLALPLIGLKNSNLIFLMSAEFIASAISGWLAPLTQRYVRMNFQNEELPLITIYGVYLFTANFVAGQFGGTILHALVGSKAFLFFDMASYFLAAILIATAGILSHEQAAPPVDSANKPRPSSFQWAKLTPTQQRIFLLLPLLSLICAPLMSVLPSRASQLAPHFQFMGVVVIAPLWFLLFRSAGQMIGPLLIKNRNFETLINHPWLFKSCALGYLALYLIIFNTSQIVVALFAIVIAHTGSNVIYTLSSFGLPRYFSQEEIGEAAARHYQVCVLATTAGGIIGGAIANYLGLNAVVIFSSIPLTILWWHLNRTLQTN